MNDEHLAFFDVVTTGKSQITIGSTDGMDRLINEINTDIVQKVFRSDAVSKNRAHFLFGRPDYYPDHSNMEYNLALMRDWVVYRSKYEDSIDPVQHYVFEFVTQKVGSGWSNIWIACPPQEATQRPSFVPYEAYCMNWFELLERKKKEEAVNKMLAVFYSQCAACRSR